MVIEIKVCKTCRKRKRIGKSKKTCKECRSMAIPGLELERVLKSMEYLEKGKGRSLDEILAEIDD